MMFLLPLVAAYVEAAETGTVRGSIADDGDLAIPRVSVILSGPGIAGEMVVESDDDGNFRFLNVPVGTHELRALKTGFSPIRRKVTVRLDEAAFVPITLKVGAEEMVIEEELPVIDATRSAVSTQLTKDALDLLPVGRSYQDVVNMVPGVSGRVDTSSGGSGDGNPSVRGEGQYGNNYLLDGISTRDPATKTFGSNVNFDAIEEIQVYTDGAPAEFGQATGMIVNVVTKDGGDEHHGSAGYFVGMAATSGQYELLGQMEDKDDFMSHSLSLTAGGPIKKEKLWYFTSIDLGTNTYQYAGADEDTPYLGYDGGGFFKLTWFASPDVKLRYQLNAQVTRIENSITSSQVSPEAQELYMSDDFGNMLQAVWLPTATTEMDVKALTNLSHINVVPMSGDGAAPQLIDLDTGLVSGNASAFDYNTRTRNGITYSVTQLVDNALGDHRIKGGIEAWELSESRELDYTGPDDGLMAYYYSSSDRTCSAEDDYSQCEYLQTFDYVGALPHRSVTFSSYLQDDWQPVDFLTVNAGARLDHEELYTAQGSRILEQWMPAPRLGVAWDATRDSKTAVTLNYGRYYDVNGSAFAEWGDTKTSAGYTFWAYDYEAGETVPVYTQGAYPLVFCTPESLAAQPQEDVAALEEICNGELRAYHMDKIVLGVKRELFPLFAVGIKGILSQTVDLPEDINYDDYYWVITNPDNKRRDYWAVELTAERKFDEHWQLLASYTLSEAKGTMPGQFETASGGDFGSNGNEVGVWGDDIADADTRAWYFDNGYGEYVQGYYGLGSATAEAGYYGYLPYHSLHQAKLNGSYTHSFGKMETTVGAVYEFLSGLTWEKRALVENYVDYLQFPEGRGTRFTNPLHYFDVSAAVGFQYDEDKSAELAVDVFNVLDLSEITTYYANEGALFGEAYYRQEPRSVRASLTVTY